MKKRALVCLLILACLFSLFPVVGGLPIQAQAATAIPDILLYEQYPTAKEFQISTEEGLQKFSKLGQTNHFSGKTLRMICDIDMAGFSYTPPVNFAGVFDGGFHTVKYLTVTTNDTNCGFVGKLTSTGVLRNLGIVGGVFTATCSKDSWRAGCLAGIVDKGLVENCWSSSDITISGGYDYLSVGGIAGGLHNGGIIKNCYFAGSVTGINVAAGICGWAQGHNEGSVGQIYNCFNMGNLVATTKYAIGRYSGSILDANKTKAMYNNYYFDSSYTGYDWSSGDTLVSKAQLGSGYLAYILDKNSPLSGSPVWSQGALFPELRKTAGVYPLTVTYIAKGKSSTATLYFNAGDTYTVGVPDSITVTLSANAGTVSGRSFVMPNRAASLSVTVNAANIADYSSFPNESVYVVTNRAGFTALGTAVNSGTTFSGKSFYMLGDVDLNNASHTPIGKFDTNSSWPTSFSGKFYGNNFKVLNLNVNNTSLNGGGLFGSCYKAYFNNLHIFNGSVTVANRAGGITGYADSCTFEYCTNGASIMSTTGVDGIGGLAGVARASSVFNYCGNYGTITATVSAAAGIAGWGQGNVKMTGCFNAGKVTAPSDVGAFARVSTGYTPEFKDCYYMKSACATTVAGKGYTEKDFRCGKIGSYINTSYRTKTSNGVFTNTPALPAVRNQNQQPAICCRLYSYADSVNLGYQLICGNLGDDVPYTSAPNYYSATPHCAPDAVTAKAYPTGVPFLITYQANNGVWKAEGPSSYTRVPGVGLPDETAITRDGYAFAGWFEQSNFAGQPMAVIPPNSTGNKTLYAKWSTIVEIGTVDQYIAFAKAVNAGNSYSDKYVLITANLDFGGQTIPTIGTEAAPFSGVLDGGGHILSNFAITGDNAQGLVGYLEHGTVKFVRVESATISGKTNTGTVVGKNNKGLILGCMSSAEVKSTWTTYDYSLMSQNVRHGNDPSPNSTNERIPRMKTHLQTYSPDIVGFQEFDSTWQPVIESVLTGYDKQLVYGNTTAKNEGSPLYWKSSKFTALEKGTFWLSETPDVMSLGFGAGNHRTCSYAVLKVKTNGMLIIAVNTHLDHKVEFARTKGMELIMERMTVLKAKYDAQGYKEIYFHMTGDFNTEPSSALIQDLSTKLTDARYAAVSLGTPLNQNTFSAYNATPTKIIDYMFISNNVDVTTYKVVLDKINGNAISDHYGLYGTIRIGGNSHGGIAGENSGVIISCAYTGKISSNAGSAGIAAENNGNILDSYSQYTATATGVFANAITTQYNAGKVDHCYYPSDMGLAGAGSTVADLKAKSVPDKMNKLVSLWVRNDAVNNGLPFICRNHEYIYVDRGDGTHSVTCSACGMTTAESHKVITDKSIAPTCTEAGKTEGSHCEICKAVLVAQTTVPAKGHSYTYKITTEGTCTDAGVKTYTCSTCGHSYTEAISAIGHSYSYQATKQPTSSATGTLTGTCSVCGGTTTVTLPKLDTTNYTKRTLNAPTCTAHGTDSYEWNTTVYGKFTFTISTAALGHTEIVEQAVAPTCTKTGLTEGKHCSVCNEALVAQEIVPATDHSYDEGTITKAPTCEAEGIRTFTCTDCGDLQTEVVSKRAHECVYVEALAPTCTEEGVYEHYKCILCTNTFLDEDCVYPLPIEYMVIPTSGHSYKVVVTEPTCEAEGTKTFTCHCGDTQTETIEKLNHKSTYVAHVAPTCTEDGLEAHYKCSRCEMTFVDEVCRYPLPVEYMVIPATGHSYTYTNNGKNHTVGCVNCDDSVTEAHTYEDGKCICGAIEVVAPKEMYVESLKPSMSIVVGAEMSVAFTVQNAMVSKYESFYLVVEKEMIGGESKTVIFGYGEDQTALTPMPNAANPFLHNASFTGLTAKEMGDEVRATLYGIGADGTLYYGPTQTDSIKSYLMRGLDLATSTPEKKTMYVDMLRYGAVAQIYFDYDTDNLVSDDLKEAHLAYATTVIPEAVDGSKAEGSRGTLNTSVVLKARVTLTLSHLKPGANLANMKFIVKDALDGTVIKELPAYNLNPVMVAADFDDVGAKQMRRLITVTLYDGNTAITDTVTWSVESYVAKIRATSTDAGQIDLVNAMLTYGDAVAAYMATQ